MTETEFEQSIVDLAHMFHWHVAGFRPAQTKHGWRTPVKYDGKGWPDLTLIHATGIVIFAEIKIPPNGLSNDQLVWQDRLEACAYSASLQANSLIRYRIWRPEDADDIATELSFGRVTSWKP